MRVAVAQLASQPGQVDANTDEALHALTQAADLGADLAVFPELFLCGYDIEGIRHDPSRHAVSLDGPQVARIAEVSCRKGISAVIGACVATAAGGLANAALVFDRQGTLVDVYGKAHLWDGERRVFAPGDHLKVFVVAEFRIGLAICYDAGFPEHARALALAGAQLIVCPSAFAVGDEHRRYHLYFPMRALENTVFVIAVNAVGSQGGLDLFGESLVCAPDGRIVLQLDRSQSLTVVDISASQVAETRIHLRYLKERRAQDLSVEEHR